MLCQAPELPISLARQQEVLEKPDEFGFKLDDVQSLMALNSSNFIYYPNPEFELLSMSGVLELKPGSPIILKVGCLNLRLMVILLPLKTCDISKVNTVCIITCRGGTSSHRPAVETGS